MFVILSSSLNETSGTNAISFAVKKNATSPSLAMGLSEYEMAERELGLHASTPQYIRRAMKASRFWEPNKSTLSMTSPSNHL
jgi:hypothetical protein